MEVPRFWRMKHSLLRLEGSVCNGCGEVSLPPRGICENCKADIRTVTKPVNVVELAEQHGVIFENKPSNVSTPEPTGITSR